MAVIVRDVFITAMDLMDEQSEDGTFDGYPDEYKNKALTILTLLQAELLPSSVTPSVLWDSEMEFQVDDRTALTVFPYGLAAHLLMTEDQSRASFFNARYDELKRKMPVTVTTITDVYNVTSGMV